jgi:hypothetical protein
MGILDDAIREHLELKRSHGASDDEIRRKESEAFGPVRPEASATAPPAAGEHTQLLTPAERPDADELQPAPEDPYAVHPGDELVPDPDAEAAPTHAAPPQADYDTPAAEAGAGMLEPHRVDPGPPSTPHERQHDELHPALVDHDHIGGEEHPPEPVFKDTPVANPDTDEPPPRQSAAPGSEEEDVLEETPEFLQDAPEHDRLWFEQKPPRDFDFGE